MRRRATVGGWVILTVGGALLASGCGDARAINKRNLEYALNHDYAVNGNCLFSKPLPFPYEVALNDSLLTETHRRLDAMAGAGLLTREREIQGPEIVDRYTLTAAGVRAAGNGRFCYGRREVTSVEKFTPPVEYNGMPLTKVEYHFVLKDGANWAKAEPVRNAFPDLAKSMSQAPVDEATLILTPDGWELTY